MLERPGFLTCVQCDVCADRTPNSHSRTLANTYFSAMTRTASHACAALQGATVKELRRLVARTRRPLPSFHRMIVTVGPYISHRARSDQLNMLVERMSCNTSPGSRIFLSGVEKSVNQRQHLRVNVDWCRSTSHCRRCWNLFACQWKMSLRRLCCTSCCCDSCPHAYWRMVVLHTPLIVVLQPFRSRK